MGQRCCRDRAKRRWPGDENRHQTADAAQTRIESASFVVNEIFACALLTEGRG
jgi:hypothetical protein